MRIVIINLYSVARHRSPIWKYSKPGSVSRVQVEPSSERGCGHRADIECCMKCNVVSPRGLTKNTHSTTVQIQVVPLSAVGGGVPSGASPTVVAREGAAAAQTVASGPALRQGVAGVVYEQQVGNMRVYSMIPAHFRQNNIER